MVPARHQLVRVTVVSPFGQHEIDLDADAPVSGFLPDLLAMAGLQPSPARLAADGWHLADAVGQPIPPHGTLAAHGVRAGSVLQLRKPEPAGPERDGPGQATRAGTSGVQMRSGVGVLRDSGAVSRHLPRTVVSSARPDDDLTPLQRVDAVLPRRTGTASRLAAASSAFLREPERPREDVVTPDGDAPDAPGQSGTQPTAAPEPGRHRYRPADLTIEAAPTRLERARVKWRELDNLGQLDARITEPRLMHCATIAVVSPKGGVGKTTVTALLGTLFSLLRRDPIVAVDTNPDFGSLGRVLTPDQTWFVDDLAQLVTDDELSLTSLDSLLGRAVHGLLVVPAPTDPDRMTALDEDAYRRVITRLKDFFSLILLDCGTGLQDPALAAAIAGADQVVLLTDSQPATASLVAESTELLHQWGKPITVVVNRMPAKGAKLDVDRLSRYLPAARGLVVVPDDVIAATRLATGRFDWRDAPPSWQLALRRLATVLVADWKRLGLAR